MSNLIDHAERELELLGNDEAMNQGILAMVAVFSTMGHSGSSAEYTTQVLARLLRYENLTPLTDDPDEWNDVSHYGGPDSPATWQCRRNPEAFSLDGGKTYYLLSERFTEEGGVRKDEKVFHESKHVEPKPPIELSTPTPDPIRVIDRDELVKLIEVSIDTEYNPYSTGHVISVDGVPVHEKDGGVIVHDPTCAVAMNPGLMSAWMFCKCRPSMLGEE